MKMSVGNQVQLFIYTICFRRSDCLHLISVTLELGVRHHPVVRHPFITFIRFLQKMKIVLLLVLVALLLSSGDARQLTCFSDENCLNNCSTICAPDSICFGAYRYCKKYGLCLPFDECPRDCGDNSNCVSLAD